MDLSRRKFLHANIASIGATREFARPGQVSKSAFPPGRDAVVLHAAHAFEQTTQWYKGMPNLA